MKRLFGGILAVAFIVTGTISLDQVRLSEIEQGQNQAANDIRPETKQHIAQADERQKGLQLQISDLTRQLEAQKTENLRLGRQLAEKSASDATPVVKEAEKLPPKPSQKGKLRDATYPVKILIDEGKIPYLSDPRVDDSFRSKDYLSVEHFFVRDDLLLKRKPIVARDAIWFSSEEMANAYEVVHGEQLERADIFQSPIVLLTWKTVAQALLKNDIAYYADDTSTAKAAQRVLYVNLEKLADFVIARKTWSDLGIKTMDGEIRIISRDPQKSGSGRVFAALIASVMSSATTGRETLTADQFSSHESVHRATGFLSPLFQHWENPELSDDVFIANAISNGMERYPIIAGFEYQFVEAFNSLPNRHVFPKGELVMLYPTPTMMGKQPMIALTQNGARLIPALQDKVTQDFAWQYHGYRPGFGNGEVTTRSHIPWNAPKEIENTLALPDAKAMERLEFVLSQ